MNNEHYNQIYCIFFGAIESDGMHCQLESDALLSFDEFCKCAQYIFENDGSDNVDELRAEFQNELTRHSLYDSYVNHKQHLLEDDAAEELTEEDFPPFAS
ncbi:hypothetical protein [Hydrogenophaga sp.]|uniref:hypothetical protein n=1 Tax=Hydrogenophaga sp. TaxID=1904254 RepID=UPI003D2AF89E